MEWKQIEDLPANWQQLASTELGSLASIWKEQSNKLSRSKDLIQFNEELRREWAIETGIIENLYSIDRGITQVLIQKGIEASLIPYGTTDKPVEEIIPILRDQEEVLEGLFSFVKQESELSSFYVRSLHQALTRHQNASRGRDQFGSEISIDLVRGEWKKWPNNPTRGNGSVFAYCPPEQVQGEMDRLIEMHKSHEKSHVPPEVEAAWLHHRLTQIHPFQDGNGRIARCLASLIFLRSGWFPLIIHRDIRGSYINSLEKADDGDLRILIELFCSVQKKALLKALSISESILRKQEPIRQIVSAANEKLKERRQKKQENLSRVFEVSKILEDLTFKRLIEVENMLKTQLSSVDSNYNAKVMRNDTREFLSQGEFTHAAREHWFHREIIHTARELGYYADTRTYHRWVRLQIREEGERTCDIVLSFHSLGVEFLGIIGVSGFIRFLDRSEESVPSTDGPHRLCDEVFQFSYNESEGDVMRRFQKWMEEVIIVGLDYWRRQL